MSKKSANGSLRSSGDQVARAKGKNVVFYDGICTFCDGSVQVLYDLDQERHLSFATLQSPLGISLVNAQSDRLARVDSIILVTAFGTDDERIDVKSTAILRIMETLGGPWKLLAPLRLLPAFLRDPFYDAFAKNRYRLFGKKRLDHCMVPGPQDADRFFD